MAQKIITPSNCIAYYGQVSRRGVSTGDWTSWYLTKTEAQSNAHATIPKIYNGGTLVNQGTNSTLICGLYYNDTHDSPTYEVNMRNVIVAQQGYQQYRAKKSYAYTNTRISSYILVELPQQEFSSNAINSAATFTISILDYSVYDNKKFQLILPGNNVKPTDWNPNFDVNSIRNLDITQTGNTISFNLNQSDIKNIYTNGNWFILYPNSDAADSSIDQTQKFTIASNISISISFDVQDNIIISDGTTSSLYWKNNSNNYIEFSQNGWNWGVREGYILKTSLNLTIKQAGTYTFSLERNINNAAYSQIGNAVSIEAIGSGGNNKLPLNSALTINITTDGGASYSINGTTCTINTNYPIGTISNTVPRQMRVRITDSKGFSLTQQIYAAGNVNIPVIKHCGGIAQVYSGVNNFTTTSNQITSLELKYNLLDNGVDVGSASASATNNLQLRYRVPGGSASTYSISASEYNKADQLISLSNLSISIPSNAYLLETEIGIATTVSNFSHGAISDSSITRYPQSSASYYWTPTVNLILDAPTVAYRPHSLGINYNIETTTSVLQNSPIIQIEQFNTHKNITIGNLTTSDNPLPIIGNYIVDCGQWS